MSAVAARLMDISTKAGIRDREVAELLGTTPQTVHRWRKAQVDPQSDHLRRILDVHFVVDELAELYEPDEARVWLHAPNRLLGNKRPFDLISRGEIDPVLQVIAMLKDGAFA
jgi:uncharacterized protein (DUF2384 family)